MARQWNNSKDGNSKYTTASAVWVEPNGDKKGYWHVGVQSGTNKYISVRLYSDKTYNPSMGKHQGKRCCVASVTMGSLNNSGNGGGSNFPQ